MKLFFDDEEFEGQFLRTVGKTYTGMADIGECFVTAARIEPGDYRSWGAEWRKTAEATRDAAKRSADAGHDASAGEAWLRACEYFRAAFFFNRADLGDEQLLADYRAHRDCFREAVAALGVECRTVEIPYGDSTLAGYLVLPERGGRWPTVVSPGGYDGTAEEFFHYTVSGALGRGYASLIFDGPGQGGSLYEKGLVFRPDYEAVLSAVVDWATPNKRIDEHYLVLAGRSFGGYLAPRAASGEHRFAALIADPGQYDLDAALQQRMPAELYEQIQAGDPKADAAFEQMFAADPHREYYFMSRAVAHGAATPAEYLRMLKDYSLAGRAAQIECPALICSQPGDEQARMLFEEITAEKQLATFSESDGAFGHCEGSAPAQFNRRVFDWLDGVLEA